MSNNESILAQEHSVLNKLGIGRETQGTLVLTSIRLLFVAANAEEEFMDGLDSLRYADVGLIDSVASNPANLSIPLDAIESTKGSKGFMTNPNLKVNYRSDSGETHAEFIQTIIGGRKKNLNDWAEVINGLKDGRIKPRVGSLLPEKGTLEGKIVENLSDLQEKGVFEIESEIEKKYSLNLDPDEVEKACGNLVSKGVLEKKGNDFYRLPSPLGSDDLSS